MRERAPRSWIDSYTNSNGASLPLCRLAPGGQAGGVGPHPQSTRLRTQTGRVPPLAQLRPGTRRSPSQGRMRLVDGSPTQGRLATPAVTQTAGLRRAATPTRRNGIPDHTSCPAGEGTQLSTGGQTPGPPRLSRGQQDRGRRRAATRPRRNGDSEHTGRPVGGGSYLPLAAQSGLPACMGSPILDPWYGDSDRSTTSDRTSSTAELHDPMSDRRRPRDVRPGHVLCLLTVGTAAHQGGAG
jgi:hypothetical protein